MRSAASFVSYAQHGEDVILWRALGDRPAGFYVDVGAFDPSDDSVTRALYERGWHGINIEPQPDRIGAFEADRPRDINLAVAIADTDGTATLHRPPVAGWATMLDPAVSGIESSSEDDLLVPVRRLDTLLAEHGVEHVDILKIDVEGAEPAVVRGLLAGPVRPVVCVVEGVGPGLGRAAGDEAVALLVEAGYTHCLFDGVNHYLTTDPALRASLSVPANPLDEYVPAAVVRLEEAHRELGTRLADLEAKNLELQAAAAAPPRPVDTTVLDPAVKASRRRAAFTKLLQSDAPEAPRLDTTPLGRLLQLALVEPAPAEAISVLYREILGRPVDPGGLADWTAPLLAGHALLGVARALAESAEALGRPPEHLARVRTTLTIWESVAAARELGLATASPDNALHIGRVGHEVFVRALFEVALQRQPTPAEAEVEISKLVAGTGREWLLRAFAARPDTKQRLLGSRRSPGLRGRLRRWQYARHHLGTFRAMVDAAEARQVEVLLLSLSAAAPALHSLARTQTSPAVDR